MTFADESTLTPLNGSIDTSTWVYYLGDGTVTKSFIFANTSINPNYAFCFNVNRTLHKTVELHYSLTGYPQRRWDDTADLTNATTNKILYLLSSSVGLYSIYSVQNQFGTPVTGVYVTAERQISGVWYTLEQGTTDSAGTVTFWLNPNFDHRITFTKSGYTTQQVTIRPSSSTYTVTMTEPSSGNYNSSLEGITWTYSSNSGQYSSQGILLNGTNMSFWFNVTSNLSNIVSCKMELINNISGILNTTTDCTSSGGNLTLTYTMNCDITTSYRLKLYIDSGMGLNVVDADAYWACMK
jgi:hypothetical protein